MMDGKKVLVTGGCGFIGSHLCERLVDLGASVIALDNFSITKNNVELLEKKGVRVVEEDITHQEKMDELCKGVDVIFHLAAMNRAVKSIKDPLLANDVNISGTLNMLNAAKNNGVKTFVNISSSSVYGSSMVFPRKEENETLPTHPYGVGKLAGEHYAKVYHELFGIDTVSLRFYSVYGPRQLGSISYAAVIPKFIEKIQKGEEIEVYGDGEQKRNFTFVADVVESTIRAATRKEAIGEVINISSDEEVTINHMITLLEEIMGKKAVIAHVDEIKGEIRSNPADISKSKKVLDFTPQVSLKEGLKQIVAWYENR